MNKVTTIISVAGMLLTAAHFKGIAHDTNGPKSIVTHASASGQSYDVGLTIDHSRYGVPVDAPAIPTAHAALTLTNTSKDPLSFRQSGQGFEWRILDSQHNVVWDYSKGRMIPQHVLIRTLAPGQKADFPCDIPLQTQDGHSLPAGAYTLSGRIAVSIPAELEIGFTVKN